MQPHSALTFFPLVCVLCLSALSQETSVVRIGVVLPVGGSHDVSDTDVRDRFVKALNAHKPDKKLSMSVQAVALDSPLGGRALEEAVNKDCDYVLYSNVKPLETSYQVERTGDGSVTNTPLATATLEYLMKRVSDGLAFVAGSARSDASLSKREAILQAVGRAGGGVLADLRKGGNGAANPLTASGTLEKMAPTLNRYAFTGTNFCTWLPTDLRHADALRGACEYAMTLPQKMPNFICHQETSRFLGQNKVPTDLITANVRYENGDESYTDFKINGKTATDAFAKSAGLWSSGQFEGNLRAIFHDGNHAVFAFSEEKQLRDRAAWVFTYRIARQNEPLWQLRAQDDVVSPPYEGELWVDAKNGEVLKFESQAKALPATFPIQSAEVTIDYDNVAFGDGMAFVLPVTSSIATRFQGFEPTRNVVQFRGCHKFRATTRIVMSAADVAGEKSLRAVSGAISRGSEIEEDETIYAILREAAIRDDAERLAMEQQEDLEWTSVAALARLAGLEKEREKNATREVAAAAHPTPPAAANESVTTIRVSVKLVPVSVVVRDGKGRPVGNLKKTDFLLFDERRPQAIGSFSIEKAGGAQAASEQGNPAPAAAFAGGKLTKAANNVAYVFDDIHSTYEDIENARDAAMRHLVEMHPEDQAAVFTTSGTVSINFTADHERLQTAVRALKSQQRSSAADCPLLSYYMADLMVNKSDGDATSTVVADALNCNFHGMGKGGAAEMEKARQLAMAKAFEMLSTGRVESGNVLAILHDVIGRTAAMPGRRTMVIISPGFLALDPDAQDKAMALIDRAVEAGVVVNTLDVRGVLTTGVSASALDLANRGQFERLEATARSAVMADFAYGTGGTFFHNNNDLDQGLRQTADMPEYIYVLGFAPQKLDGKFHKLKVKLAHGEKLTVQARAGYYALKRASAQ